MSNWKHHHPFWRHTPRTSRDQFSKATETENKCLRCQTHTLLSNASSQAINLVPNPLYVLDTSRTLPTLQTTGAFLRAHRSALMADVGICDWCRDLRHLLLCVESTRLQQTKSNISTVVQQRTYYLRSCQRELGEMEQPLLSATATCNAVQQEPFHTGPRLLPAQEKNEARSTST